MADDSKHKQTNLEDPTPPESGFTSADNVEYTDKDLNIKDFFGFDDIEFWNTHGESKHLKIVNEDYYIQPTDHFIGVISTSAARTVYLPSVRLCTHGKQFIVFDAGGSAASNLITVSGNGTTINLDATKGISTNFGKMEVMTNRERWYNLIT